MEFRRQNTGSDQACAYYGLTLSPSHPTTHHPGAVFTYQGFESVTLPGALELLADRPLEQVRLGDPRADPSRSPSSPHGLESKSSQRWSKPRRVEHRAVISAHQGAGEPCGYKPTERRQESKVKLWKIKLSWPSLVSLLARGALDRCRMPGHSMHHSLTLISPAVGVE